MDTNVFINTGDGFKPIQRADKIEAVAENSQCDLQPLQSGELNIQLSEADKDFSFFNTLIKYKRSNIISMLRAVPGDIVNGSRMREIVKCPVCNKKLYIQRNGKELKLSCSGCNIALIVQIEACRKAIEVDQIERKGYFCPAHNFNPELFSKTPAEVCPKCEHWKKDCIVYGKKKGRVL